MFKTLCQSDSSFTGLTRRKVNSNLAELVLLVHAGHHCDSHPATDKLLHILTALPTAELDCQLVTKGATLALKELAEYHHLLA